MASVHSPSDPTPSYPLNGWTVGEELGNGDGFAVGFLEGEMLGLLVVGIDDGE